MPASTSSAAIRSQPSPTCTGAWRLPRWYAARASASAVGATNLEQVFRRGDHAHDATVIRLQEFSAAQHASPLEEQADILAPGDRRAQAAFLPLLERERQLGVERRLRRNAFLHDQHGGTSSHGVLAARC